MFSYSETSILVNTQSAALFAIVRIRITMPRDSGRVEGRELSGRKTRSTILRRRGYRYLGIGASGIVVQARRGGNEIALKIMSTKRRGQVCSVILESICFRLTDFIWRSTATKAGYSQNFFTPTSSSFIAPSSLTSRCVSNYSSARTVPWRNLFGNKGPLKNIEFDNTSFKRLRGLNTCIHKM